MPLAFRLPESEPLAGWQQGVFASESCFAPGAMILMAFLPMSWPSNTSVSTRRRVEAHGPSLQAWGLIPKPMWPLATSPDVASSVPSNCRKIHAALRGAGICPPMTQCFDEAELLTKLDAFVHELTGRSQKFAG